MQVKVEKQPKSTLKLTITVPNEKVLEVYNKVVDVLVETAGLPGFRKGKAPKEKVLEKADQAELNGEVVNKLLQTYYPQALKEHHILPVSNPRVEIAKFDLDKDFEFSATVGQKPEIKIGDYKVAIKTRLETKVAAAKKANEDKFKTGEEVAEPHMHLTVDDVIDGILGVSELEVPDLLIDDEVNRMLSRLLDQTQTLGMTVEDYLQSQNKTGEKLREEYTNYAQRTLKAEFVLTQLIEVEKVAVDDAEIDEAMKAGGMQSPTEKWYIKSILAKNKLVSKLAQEAEGHAHEK